MMPVALQYSFPSSKHPKADDVCCCKAIHDGHLPALLKFLKKNTSLNKYKQATKYLLNNKHIWKNFAKYEQYCRRGELIDVQ